MSALDRAWTAVVMDSSWRYRPAHLRKVEGTSTAYAKLSKEERLALMGYETPGEPPGYLKQVEEEMER